MRILNTDEMNGQPVERWVAVDDIKKLLRELNERLTYRKDRDSAHKLIKTIITEITKQSPDKKG